MMGDNIKFTLLRIISDMTRKTKQICRLTFSIQLKNISSRNSISQYPKMLHRICAIQSKIQLGSWNSRFLILTITTCIMDLVVMEIRMYLILTHALVSVLSGQLECKVVMAL